MKILETGTGTRVVKSRGLDPRAATREEIPIIDLTPMFGAERASKEWLAASLRKACCEIGFFYIRNHGVSGGSIAAIFAAAHSYFVRTQEEKKRDHVSLSPNNRGYAALLEENTDSTARGDLHESFDIALDVPADDPDVKAGKVLYGPNQWPEGLVEFKVAMNGYYAEMRALSSHLLHGFALSLDLAETYFDSLVTKPLATLRVLHYPPQFGEIDDRQIGIGAHSDYECFTILAQDDVPALQVLSKEGEWIAADPIPGCLLVNIGDQMARWTNDLFASTVHRAINRSGRERYSVPFFFGPNYDAVIQALPSCIGPDRQAKYAPIKAGEYINERFAATFSHYRASQSVRQS